MILRNFLKLIFCLVVEILRSLSLVDFKGFFINVGTFWQFYKNKADNPLDLYVASKNAFLKIIDYHAQTTSILFTNIYLNDTYRANDTRVKSLIFGVKSQKVAKF